MNEIHNNVKKYLLKNISDVAVFSSLNDDYIHENLSENHHRISLIYTHEVDLDVTETTRPIRFMVCYDEDIEKGTNRIKQKQVCLIMQSMWEVEEDLTKIHYFINNEEDLDFEKIKEFYNNLFNTYQYNNFDLIQDDLEDFITEIKYGE